MKKHAIGTVTGIVTTEESVTEIEEMTVTETVNVRETRRVTANQRVTESVTLSPVKKNGRIRIKGTQLELRKQVNKRQGNKNKTLSSH